MISLPDTVQHMMDSLLKSIKTDAAHRRCRLLDSTHSSSNLAPQFSSISGGWSRSQLVWPRAAGLKQS